MSENIIDMVKGQLGGGTLNKLSSYLGESNETTQFGLGAAIPTLLAGLTHTASTPEGAQKLSAAAAEHENVVSNFGDSIASQGGSLATKGSSMFSSLLGGGMASGLTSVLGRFTGLKSGTASNLIGLCMPLVLGVLGKHQRSAGLSPAGLSGFLTSQKQNIAGAMPSGLSSMLGSIPGLSGFAKAPQEEVGAAKKAVYEREPRVTRAEPVGEVRPRRWGLGIAAVAAAVALALWGVSRRTHETTRVAQNQTINEPAGSAAPSAPALKTGLNETLADLNTTLNGITDSNSADKAMPRLDQINSKLADLHSNWDKLPDSAKPSVASSLHTEQINDKIANLRTVSGVGDKLKPVLDQIEQHLSSFTAGPTPTGNQ